MSSPGSTRPQRQRRRNPRYDSVAWDKATLRRLRAASTSSGSSPSNSEPDTDSADDEEFAGHTLQPSSEDDDDPIASEASDLFGDGSDEDNPRSPTGKISRMSFPGIAAPSGTMHARGLRDVPRNHSKKTLYPLTFGPSEEDLAPINHAHEHWLRGRDVILPSRSTLADPNSVYKAPAGHVEERSEEASSQSPFIYRKELRQLIKEASSTKMQLEATDAELKLLHARQKLKVIDEEIAKAQQYLPKASSHSIVLGPPDAQYISNIEAGGTCALANQESPRQEPHQGWLLNLGEKGQAISWAPVLGSKQYLAVTVRCTPAQREVCGATPPPFGPAFSPSAPYPSSVQLWSFESIQCGYGDYLTLDTKKPPQLEQVVGLRCGDIRYLEWAPVSPLNTNPQAPRALAVLSSDSHVRTLSFDFSSPTTTPTYTELETASVDITPPTDLASSVHITGETQPIFTTLTWASTKELIIGTSTGHIHIYNIHAAPHPTQPNPTPLFTHALHETYITALCAPLPLPLHPTSYNTQPYIASSSTTGDMTLTSLTHPTSSSITYSRARLPSRHILYLPQTRSFLTASEPSARNTADHFTTAPSSSSTVACHHLRRFYSVTQVALLPLSRGSVTALAGSVWHPSVLMGSAGGEVWGMNYLRKVLVGRPGTRGRGAWVGRVVRGDWRPASVGEKEGEKGGAAVGEVADKGETLEGEVETETKAQEEKEEERGKKDLFHGPPTRKGVTRLTFGFKPEPVDLTRNPGGRSGTGKSRRVGGGMKTRKARGDDHEEDGLDDGDGEVDGDGDVEMQDADEAPAGRKAKAANVKGKAKKGGRPGRKGEDDVDVAGEEIIFEEEQAVTALAWNVNRQTAGWAAVGWGSGIVMVRDLSVEL